MKDNSLVGDFLAGSVETWVQSLDWEDLLEKGMATHSTSLAWEDMDIGACGLWPMGFHRLDVTEVTACTHARDVICSPWVLVRQ